MCTTTEKGVPAPYTTMCTTENLKIVFQRTVSNAGAIWWVIAMDNSLNRTYVSPRVLGLGMQWARMGHSSHNPMMQGGNKLKLEIAHHHCRWYCESKTATQEDAATEYKESILTKTHRAITETSHTQWQS